MSKIAQQLCNDLVRPSLKPSHADHTVKKPSNIIHTHSTINSKKPTRSNIIEKKKVINKVSNPSNNTASRSGIQSKETILCKKILDKSVNTVVTGPWRCDNNCVTDVRKRDYKGICKCGQRGYHIIVCSKQIQTLLDSDKLLSRADKACTQSVNMTTRGSQFLDGSNICSKNERREKTSTSSLHVMKNTLCKKIINEDKPSYLNNFRGAQRWALTHRPIRGPDF